MRTPRNKIAYMRMKKLLSQSDVAKILGISQSYYARLERYPKMMSIEMGLKVKEIIEAPTIESMLDAI